MAGKFVDLKKPPKMIGVSPEELVEMRSKGDIFGYRDGASWKFKMEEVERVIRERGVEARGGDSAILTRQRRRVREPDQRPVVQDPGREGPGRESGSVLISEEELGVSATGQSTIIGKGKEPAEADGDSDLQLADDGKTCSAERQRQAARSTGQQARAGGASDVLHGSDIKSTGGSGTGEMPAAKARRLDGRPGSGRQAEPGRGRRPGTRQQRQRPRRRNSARRSGQRHRQRHRQRRDARRRRQRHQPGSPTDSGLSLEEEPLDLGGSAVESLELPEDEEVISLDDEAADPDQATQLKADNEFLLSPPATKPCDDESDSGSQVIALEDSESFDQDAATMLKSEPGGALAADAFQPMGGDAGMGMGGGRGQHGAGQPVYVQVPVVEAPYSVWNVLSLGGRPDARAVGHDDGRCDAQHVVVQRHDERLDLGSWTCSSRRSLDA